MDPLDYLPAVVASVLHLTASITVTFHAVLRKSDVRAAVGWIGLVWLSPIIGIALYALFGVNRIRRTAAELRRAAPAYNRPNLAAVVPPDRLPEHLKGHDHLVALGVIGESNIARPLVGGNHVEPLLNGDEAYPAMLEAIGAAKQSVTLLTYIFDNDRTGQEFVDALAEAVTRGVEVRVLIDAAGSRYTFPSVVGALKARGVPVARFLPSSIVPPYIMSLNLRNHRKIMVVDGEVGFAGGINIRDASWLSRNPRKPTRDLHFRITGPIVHELQQIFVEDWMFTTREELTGEVWFTAAHPAGDVIARAIPDGPDEDLDKLRWTMLGAIGVARESIRIVTPYFLPDEPIAEALIVAAMSGVRVDVVMPQTNNLPYVAWACSGQLEPLLRFGIHVWYVPGDFDHSKVCVVDDAYVLLGSPNWDPRSTRLNFEFALECFDAPLAQNLSEWVDGRIKAARRWTLTDHQHRSWPRKLRDSVFRLAAPYL